MQCIFSIKITRKTRSIYTWSCADPAAIRGGGIIGRASATLAAPKRLHEVFTGSREWPPGGVPGVSTVLSREILYFKTQFAQFGAYFLPPLYWKSIYSFPIKNGKKFLFFLSRSAYESMPFSAHTSPL